MMRVLFVALFLWCALAVPAEATQQWLVVSDIHFDPFASNAEPSGYGSDSNAALLDSALARMRAVEAHPAVVVLVGDLLAHHFAARARRYGARPEDAALNAMRAIATRFSKAYPGTPFIVALGNNDDYCGDYRSESRGSYQRDLARIWSPLVARANPRNTFDASFVHGGYYSVEVGRPRVRVLVLNDVPWSIFARGSCDSSRARLAADERAWFARKLAQGRATVIVGHIPPGVDAGATAILRGLWKVPFLKSADEHALERGIDSGGVRFALFGHTHRFDLRAVGAVPAIIAGSISPVYGNNPAFYTLSLDGAGNPIDVRATYYDEVRGRWRSARSLDRAFGVTRMNRATFAQIHASIAADTRVRARWEAQAVSWSSVAMPSWRYAWCAQNVRSRGYMRCAGLGWRVAMLWSAICGVCGALGWLIWRRFRLASKHR